MKKALLIITAIIFAVASLIPWTYSIVQAVKFSANCSNYLSLAADANSIDVAEKHLSKAITYLEENNLTSGHTKIFVYYPRNDIGLWYENLKTAQSQLKDALDSEITDLEESNILMKLRETILNSEGSITHPNGISLMPNYRLMFWLNLLLWIPCWFAVGAIYVLWDDLVY